MVLEAVQGLLESRMDIIAVAEAEAVMVLQV